MQQTLSEENKPSLTITTASKMTSSFEKKNKNKNKKIPRNRRPGVVNFSLDAVPFNKKKGNRC